MGSVTSGKIIADAFIYRHRRAGDNSVLADMIRSATDSAGPDGAKINAVELRGIKSVLFSTPHNDITAFENLLGGIRSGTVALTPEANEKKDAFIRDTADYVKTWRPDEPSYTISEAMINNGQFFVCAGEILAVTGAVLLNPAIEAFGLGVLAMGGGTSMALGFLGELIHSAIG